MSPLSLDEALQYVDPSLSDESPGAGQDSPRVASAKRLQEGVRANEVYWNHRPDLEALRAQAEGHGVLVRGADDAGADEPAIEGTATDIPAAAIGTTTPPPADEVPASPDNSTDAVARLRQQLTDAGIQPEA